MDAPAISTSSKTESDATTTTSVHIDKWKELEIRCKQLQRLFDGIRLCNVAELNGLVQAVRDSSDPGYIITDVELPNPMIQVEFGSDSASNKLDFLRIPGSPLLSVPAKAWTNVTHSDEMVSHLMSLYFTWEYPTLNWINRHSFLQAMIAGDTEHCSTLLVNTILAQACVCVQSLLCQESLIFLQFYLSSNESLSLRQRKRALAQDFLSEAERLWNLPSTENPITRIQAALILNCIYSGQGKDKFGKQYFTEGIQLAIDMGLQHERTALFSTGEDTFEYDGVESGLAMIAWGVFNFQAYVSLHGKGSKLIFDLGTTHMHFVSSLLWQPRQSKMLNHLVGTRAKR
jgi:hypothetical protein